MESAQQGSAQHLTKSGVNPKHHSASRGIIVGRSMPLLSGFSMFAMKVSPVTIALLLLAVFVDSYGLAQQPATPQPPAAKGAVRINRVEDVITHWSQDQHLYVKGNIGVSQSQLKRLEDWLDKHGPHWTIVLMQDAKDEDYSSLDQRRFKGMDAVEFALGHGLANRTAFGSLLHEKTGETSGAVFVLFLVERKFSYYGSDLHDRRGLGESKWIGELDREAVRAMRNGGRIIDAVKNTVNSINRRVTKKLKAEAANAKRAAAAKERAKAERLRGIENLQSSIEETKTAMLKRVENSAREIRANFPEAASSKLALPPLDDWRSKLNDLAKDAADPQLAEEANVRRSERFQKTKSESDAVRGQINQYLDSYAAHRSFADMLSPVETRLDGIADHPSGAAIETSKKAYQLLDDARRGHARGELSFADSIRQAGKLVESGEQAVKQRQRQLQQQAEQKRFVRNVILITASVLAAIFIGLMWLFNMRRRPALRRAHALFDKRSKAVANELEKVDEILAYSDKVIGSKEAFLERGFEGNTLHLGNTTLQKIDNLKTMSSEVERAIGSAYELLHPSNPLAEATNMFTATRYEHCIEGLNSKTLQVPGRVDEHGAVQESAWMTFDEFFSDLHDRKTDTSSNLDTFKVSLDQIKRRVDELQAKIDEATGLEQELSKASRLDRYFKLPALFDQLLPSAQLDCDRASAITATDPVKATSEHVPVGMRKITEGLAVAQTISRARNEVFPALDQAADELKKLGFDTRWIPKRVNDFSAHTDSLMIEAMERSINTEAEQFSEDISQLGFRARRSVELARQLTSDVAPALEQLSQRINEARTTVSTKLKIDQRHALHEQEYDPDVELNQARNQLTSARAAVDYGGVESAMESLEVLAIETSQADRLIEMTLTALTEFTPTHQQRANMLVRLKADSPAHAATVETIKSKWADSAMTFRDSEFIAGTWDEHEPDDDHPTVVEAIRVCNELLDVAGNTIEKAQSLHREGKVLQAANLLELVHEDLQDVEQMGREVEEHNNRLDQLAIDNTNGLDQRTERLASVEKEVSDHRTQSPTLEQFSDLSATIGDFAAAFKQAFKQPSTGRDPFLDAKTMVVFDERIEDLLSSIKADRQAFEEASRAVGGAENELSVANRLVTTSVNDRIPDSVTTKQCQDAVTALKLKLDTVKQRLKIANEDWQVVDAEATELNVQLGVIGGRLRQELDLANQAVKSLSDAAEAVYASANWRGRYGIVVVGQPGSLELDKARSLLAQGVYGRSQELSRSAKTQANDALDDAKRRVARRKRKLAREAAAARRRRSSSSSSFGVSSFSSGRSSFGSSSSSSFRSSSSSSFRSSSSSSSGGGSGFSRSGW